MNRGLLGTEKVHFSFFDDELALMSKCQMFELLLWFLDEFSVDYNQLVKPTAVEGQRVENLVKQYFEATEQVHSTHTVHSWPVC